MKTVTNFISLGSKITKDNDCSHKIKRFLVLGRTTMTNLHNILKSRDHFADKGAKWSKLWFFQYSWVNVRVGP